MPEELTSGTNNGFAHGIAQKVLFDANICVSVTKN
jgi:hypothetical protein